MLRNHTTRNIWLMSTLLLFAGFIVIKWLTHSPGDFLPKKPEALEKEERSRWLEIMHQSKPGTDWRTIEYERRYELSSTHKNRLHLRSEPQQESWADGRLMGNWFERGSSNQAGSVDEVVFDVENGSLFLLSAGGSLWKGQMNGDNWTVVNDDLTFDASFLKIIRRSSEKRLIAFISRMPHYSDDLGVSWKRSTGIEYQSQWGTFKDPIMVNDARQTIFVLSKTDYWEPVKLHQSQQDGATFKHLATFPAWDMEGLALFHPTGSASGFLMEKTNTGKAKIFRLQAGQPVLTPIGDTTLSLGNARANLAGIVNDSIQIFYAFSEQEEGKIKLFQSKDLGTTWSYLSDLPELPWRESGIYASALYPSTLFLGAVNCYVSRDGGKKWKAVNQWWEYYDSPSSKLHADIMNFAECRGQDNQPFHLISNHGGLYISRDNMVSVENLSLTGLNVGQYYSVRTHPEDSSHVFAGSQDQGLQFSSGLLAMEGPASFDQWIEGDYGHLAFTDKGQVLWAVYPGGTIYIFDNRIPSDPKNLVYSLPVANEVVWMPPIVSYPSVLEPNSNTVLMAGGSADSNDEGSFIVTLEYAKGGVAAKNLPFDFKKESGGGVVSALATSPLNPEHLFAATTNGRFFFSKDSGKNWEQNLNFIPDGHYLYGQVILASSLEQGRIWLGGSGYSNPAVYLSEDGGRQFVAFTQGLPPTLVLDLDTDEMETMIFAATEAGPFVYLKEADKWFELTGSSAPAQAYWSVEYIPSLRTARFGTYGRGIWDFHIDQIVSSNQNKAVPLSMQIKAFPNPCSRWVTLNWPATEPGDWQIILWSLAGNNMANWTYSAAQKGTVETTLNLEPLQLTQGIYWLSITNGKQQGQTQVMYVKL